MCEFCLKHGEGEKWYLRAQNYSEDLLSDLQRRKFIKEFFADPMKVAEQVTKLEELDHAPALVRNVVRRLVLRRMKKWHYGQVVPIEEIERIFDFVGSITRVACYCRFAGGKKEKRYCYGVSLSPRSQEFAKIFADVDSTFLSGPDTIGLEKLTKEEALEAFRQHERDGLCHTVWTFKAPFIGGICNCDRTDCLAMRCTVSHQMPVMFRAEYVAQIEPEKCSGCRQCMRMCQFGAIGFSASDKKSTIDQRWCYGCGICRTACSKDAITLKPRREVSAVAKLF